MQLSAVQFTTNVLNITTPGVSVVLNEILACSQTLSNGCVALRDAAVVDTADTTLVRRYRAAAGRAMVNLVAAVEDLMAVGGISESMARQIYAHFHDNG